MIRWQTQLSAIVAATGLLGAVAGCSTSAKCDYMGDITPTPLGTISDPIWQTQEANAEANDFVIYEHEWSGNSATLNEAGKDHVKLIAARANQQKFPIILQPSSRSKVDGTEFEYPVNNNGELDARRRELIVEALTVLNVPDAVDRVVVAPELSTGFYSFQSQQAFRQAFQGNGNAGR